MLIALQIENFALVDRLELEFGTGLNVMTGETGAGKSIILDALDAALGGKATARAIRTGSDRALIEATFSLTPALADWLNAQEIELIDDQSLICSRELVASRGNVRSRSRINGVLTNKQQMEELRDRLVEITAQGQTVQLGQAGVQREWLDSFGGTALMQQREAVAATHAAFQKASQALDRRRRYEQERLQQLDMFEYHAKELHAANLEDPNEIALLEQERQRLSHSVELQRQSYQVYQILYQNDAGESACADLMGKAEEILTDMLRYDPELEPILGMVSDALAKVEEAGRQINAYGEGLETDPERLQEVQERIVLLKQLCRKLNFADLGEAIAYHQKLQLQLDELSDAGHSVEVLEQECNQRRSQLVKECAQLTALRQSAAQALESLLLSELKPLAMDKVQFKVDITPIAPSSLGGDRITYLFSPNPGEPMQPLTEVASGGEMSRFLLALKSCFSQVDPIGTMVFDEIDVGVSGRVVKAIAEKLHQLGHRHQVLCVTHQPIVAAIADTHFRVSKQVVEQATATSPRGRGKASPAAAMVDPLADPLDDEGLDLQRNGKPADEVRTVVRVSQLDDQQRREELAQLAGGKTDEDAIAFADSLLSQAATSRQAPDQPVAAAESQPEPLPEPPATPAAKPKATRAKKK